MAYLVWLTSMVVTTQEKGGLEVAGSNDARMGQMLLDRIRIKHAIAQGADPKYVLIVIYI